MLKYLELLAEDILDKIEEFLGAGVKTNFSVLGFTPRTKKILEKTNYNKLIFR